MVLQRIDCAAAITQFLVLTQFGFRDNPADANLDSYDCLEHAVDVVGIRVCHSPWARLAGALLMLAGQPGNEASHIALIIMEQQFAVHMDHLVVPGGHLAMRFMLARIPVR